MENDLLSVAQAAAQLGLTGRGVQRLIAQGRLDAYVTDDGPRISAAALQRCSARQRRPDHAAVDVLAGQMKLFPDWEGSHGLLLGVSEPEPDTAPSEAGQGMLFPPVLVGV
jgi:excisionase family DNA binding protein